MAKLIARLFLTATGIYLFTVPFNHLYLVGIISTRWPIEAFELICKSILGIAILFVWWLVFYQVWFKADDWAGLMVGAQGGAAIADRADIGNNRIANRLYPSGFDKGQYYVHPGSPYVCDQSTSNTF